MNILEAEDLRKSFTGRKGVVEAVKGISLRLEAGEILGFLGPNGAGKTTTIKMLTSLIRRDAGSVLVMGRDPDRDRRALREIGTVLEGNRNLYWRLSPIENLEYFGATRKLSLRRARRRGSALLERFGLEDKRRTPVRKLSRGMQQKLALCVALLHRPKLLLMDEPTLGLDVEAAVEVKGLIREIASEGRAVLLTTHQLGDAEEISDRLAIIREGEIIAEDTTADLLERFSGDAYRLEVEGEIDDQRASRIEQLGGWVKDGRIEYLGAPEGIYPLLAALAPLPIVRVEKDREDLTGIFLKLIREGRDESLPR